MKCWARRKRTKTVAGRGGGNVVVLPYHDHCSSHLYTQESVKNKNITGSRSQAWYKSQRHHFLFHHTSSSYLAIRVLIKLCKNVALGFVAPIWKANFYHHTWHHGAAGEEDSGAVCCGSANHILNESRAQYSQWNPCVNTDCVVKTACQMMSWLFVRSRRVASFYDSFNDAVSQCVWRGRGVRGEEESVCV